ncbi:hypothetical protein D3C86_1422920 [compost metagenome]
MNLPYHRQVKRGFLRIKLIAEIHPFLSCRQMVGRFHLCLFNHHRIISLLSPDKDGLLLDGEVFEYLLQWNPDLKHPINFTDQLHNAQGIPSHCLKTFSSRYGFVSQNFFPDP